MATDVNRSKRLWKSRCMVCATDTTIRTHLLNDRSEIVAVVILGVLLDDPDFSQDKLCEPMLLVILNKAGYLRPI